MLSVQKFEIENTYFRKIQIKNEVVSLNGSDDMSACLDLLRRKILEAREFNRVRDAEYFIRYVFTILIVFDAV